MLTSLIIKIATGFQGLQSLKPSWVKYTQLSMPPIIRNDGFWVWEKEWGRTIDKPLSKTCQPDQSHPGKIVVNAEQFNEDQLRLCMIGIIHAGYTLKHYKKDANGISGRDIEIYAPQNLQKAYATASAIAAGSQTAMDLVNLPSNIKDPSYLADFTKN